MEFFGEWKGLRAERIRLERGPLSCELLSYGAALRALRVPDRQGRPVDVVLGFDRLEDYVNQQSYIGATVGPVANRIAGAACLLNGTPLRLSANEGANSLHSGEAGLDRRIWTVEEAGPEAAVLCCVLPDGLGGLPGPIRFAVCCRLTADGLELRYEARSQRDTLCSLTNHSYFNLDGHASGSVLDHSVSIAAGAFTPTDAQSIPTGELRPVAGTAMDLRQPVRIGSRIDAPEPQLTKARGFDHNYVLDPASDPETGLIPAARAVGPRSGIAMTVLTDRPAVQFYTGNFLPAGLRGKNGAVYGPRSGFCMETQAFPDAPHHPAFPSILLPAGETWRSRTLLRFSTVPAEA